MVENPAEHLVGLGGLLANLNIMLAPFDFQLGQCSEKTLALDGKYLCHHKQREHFTGLHASEGFFQVFHNEEVKHWNVGQVADLAGSDDVTCFELQYVTPKSIVMAKNLDAFIGGAPKKLEVCLPIDYLCVPWLPWRIAETL